MKKRNVKRESQKEAKIIQKTIETLKNTSVRSLGWQTKQRKCSRGKRRIKRETNGKMFTFRSNIQLSIRSEEKNREKSKEGNYLKRILLPSPTFSQD